LPLHVDARNRAAVAIELKRLDLHLKAIDAIGQHLLGGRAEWLSELGRIDLGEPNFLLIGLPAANRNGVAIMDADDEAEE
jgi:hypothetical protein